jgi:hypothetical protein
MIFFIVFWATKEAFIGLEFAVAMQKEWRTKETALGIPRPSQHWGLTQPNVAWHTRSDRMAYS